MFEIGLAPEPVFRDGVSTDRTYMFVAVKPGPYNGVVYSPQREVIKFYPDAQFWGLTNDDVKKATSKNLYDKPSGGYQGIHGATVDDVRRIMDMLRGKRQTVVVDQEIFDTFINGKPPMAEVRSRARTYHPYTNGVPSEHDMPTFLGERAYVEA